MRYSKEILRCPKGCYVTDMEVFRCPKCDTQLQGAGPANAENRQRITDEVAQEQRANDDKLIRSA